MFIILYYYYIILLLYINIYLTLIRLKADYTTSLIVFCDIFHSNLHLLLFKLQNFSTLSGADSQFSLLICEYCKMQLFNCKFIKAWQYNVALDKSIC